MRKSLNVALIFLLVAFLTGCGNPEGEQRTFMASKHHCTPETAQQRADFILRCVEGANPKSDEEPEDWIGQCQHMAEETLCTRQTVAVVQQCAFGEGLFGSCSRWREVSLTPTGN